MRKVVVGLIIAACAGVVGFMAFGNTGSATVAPGGAAPAGMGRGGRGFIVRPPMPVEFAAAKRAPVEEYVSVVGNLIGAATVLAVPKVNGRLESVRVKLGDPVRRGQVIAKVEDREIQEQVRASEASYEVARATIRQRQADLKLAQSNLERNRSLLERQLLPRQTYDDTDARYQAAVAQVELAEAQFDAAKARLDELRINLANTVISSPVDGFVGKRFLDAGAFVSPNAPVASLVDIRTVRLVANLVEKDVRLVATGTPAEVEVDAFPGEKFAGQVSRVAPVFDPATRTAEMEIEVPNPGFRLKPGMYARVQLTVATRDNALTVPTNAVVNLNGTVGVFVAATSEGRGRGEGRSDGGRGDSGRGQGAPPSAPAGAQAQGAQPGDSAPSMTARFVKVETGLRDGERVEITAGLTEGSRVITTGAGALKDGDRITPAKTASEGDRGRGNRGRGERGASNGSEAR